MSFFLFLCIAGYLIWLIIRKSPSNNDNSSSHSNPGQYDEPVQQSSVLNYEKTNDISIQTKLAVHENGQWLSQGNLVNINGYSIPDGFIYVGKGLKSANGYQIECALIDPSLRVDNNNNDYRVRRLDYWPSYSESSPDARASYLKWLSTGKNDPSADIGYVFLYFYGLERRLLYDSAVSDTEIQALVNEVKRLLSIYGDNSSFNTYANSLIAYVQTQLCDLTQYKIVPPNPTNHFGLPISLRICLGQMAKDGTPIPADWALTWYFSTPNPPVYARTPAHRCQQEFQALFKEEYSRTFGTGIKITENKTRLKIEHKAASKSLLGRSFTKALDIPDVSRQTSVINKIAPIIQTCQDKLDSYSRYLGRNPENKDTLDAFLELPVSIWPDNIKNDLNSLQSILSEKNEFALKFSDVLDYFPEWQDKSKKRFLLFMECLDSNHIGFEPDFRITGIKPDLDTQVILFPLFENDTNDISAAYELMALIMHLAVMVSEADGKVSDTEINVLKHQIERSVNLKYSEKKRLNVYLQWLISQQLSTKGMKKKLQSLQASERELIVDLMIQVSLADGMISASEIKLMEKVFKQLDIDSNVLYSKIHSSYAEPITVKAATDSRNGFSIPAPPDSPTPAEKQFSLDMNKIASLNSETKHVGNFLNSIFNQEEEEAPIEPDVRSVDRDETWGLSTSVFEIVQFLSHKSAWHRRELEEMAYNKNLMLEGVLEQINEAAFERFDEPFIEGEDPFEINQEIAMVVNQ